MDENPIVWTGDLDDDCLAEWNGFLLCAEWEQDDLWFWCVVDQATGEQLVSCDWGASTWEKCYSGEAARAAAEKAARIFAAIK